MILLLHLLVVAAALFRLPGLYEIGHALEDFISSSQIFVNEMSVMQLQKPVVKLVFLGTPVPLLDILCLLLRHLHLRVQVPFLRLLFVFFSGEPDMTLLAEERLEVVARNDFLVFLKRLVG